VVDPTIVPVPGLSGPGIIPSLQHGDPNGSVWRPAEADTSIRPGWFHHPAEDGRVRSVENLMTLFFRSVGRNAKLLLNVPPTRDGVLHPTDVARLEGFAERRRALLGEDLIETERPTVVLRGGPGRVVGVEFPREVRAGVIRLSEPIERGQAVRSFVVSGSAGDGPLAELARGATVGHARLERFVPRAIRRLRIDVDGDADVQVRVFGPAGTLDEE
jgi:alpha-L-fucosidase